MSKAAKVTTDLPAAPAVAPAQTVSATMQIKPQAVWITDSHMKALHKMTALCRDGYIPTEINAFGFTGMTNIVMERGDPEPTFVAEACTDVQAALEMEEHQRKMEIEAAAARLVAERERAERRQAMELQILAQEQALAVLRAQAANQ